MERQRLQEKNLEVLRAGRLCSICAKAEEAIAVKNQLGAKSMITSELIDCVGPGHQFYLGCH